jgi:hypothetical protein
VYAREGSENYMTSRLDTLLKKFGFENRWKYLVDTKDYLKCFQNQDDYETQVDNVMGMPHVVTIKDTNKIIYNTVGNVNRKYIYPR